MAFTSVVRGARGLSSVGRAVEAAVSRINPSTVTQDNPGPAPDTGPTAPASDAAAPAEGAPKRGFTLPDLGPAPGPDATDEERRTYAHKQDIHQAFRDLEDMYAGMEPNRDYQKEYEDQVAAEKQHEAARPKENPLARFALALGEYNPASQGSLANYEKSVAGDAARSDQSFARRMALKARAHEAASAAAEQSGNWKKALAEQEKLALLRADEESLKATRARELEGEKQTGATNRALIRREAAESTARIRAHTVGSAHGLSGGFLAQFEKESAKAVAKMLGPRDLTKEYTPADLDAIDTYVEHLAEMFHDQQYGTEDGGAARLGTHPRKRAKAPAKEQF